jgi:5'-3' exonuclease
MQTMFFIDYSLICYNRVYALREDFKSMGYEILRPAILKKIFDYIKQFSPNTVYICCDEGDSWRKEIYPEYKSQRKAAREKSEIEWDKFFSITKDIKNEMKKFLPFKVISLKNIEADDIVSVLCRKYPEYEKIIVTTDSDYKQLLLIPNTRLFNPATEKEVKMDRAEIIRFLEQKILTGDKSDNISSVEKRLGPKTADKLLDSGELDTRLLEDPVFREKYDLNKRLVDLSIIPKKYCNLIQEEDDSYSISDGSKLLEYFKDNKMGNFLYDISDIRTILNKINNVKPKEKILIEGNNKWNKWLNR